MPLLSDVFFFLYFSGLENLEKMCRILKEGKFSKISKQILEYIRKFMA